ncbi:acylneuraminate cytidylyltransferase [Thermotoga petrophila RKU-10]|jgi:N-acylneuraminate cytidylyltransferase/CMP-N,N'-diacetyllegionaminic acid synthase|uniref:Acylneuraminate cytidylyltransferase n=1 Tax=Thermotoga petrophila (strain ATCC BAA-489 / DSM 13996 / JCM 10882 / RKU-10) TaxID=590168 RepID=D2C6C9_THEP2|nr:acylneuraminate cytidylyltransferase family protein [Thermotoga petrophila]ADA66515.1 acylneuraminate cytidylyltransferase [Thermotoga petrophila RKU-10]
MKIVGIIPARRGSKGIRNKNIVNLCGKPLIYYTIKEALKSKVIDKLIVSTDSEKIAKLAKSFGAEVPFIRPKELATDDAKGIDVILHAMNWFESRGEIFDAVLVLQPTSPLRSHEDIIKAVEVFLEKKANAVVSVCEVEHHPLWANVLPDDKSMDNFIRKEIRNKNRQELPKYYRLNGAIYLARWNYLKNYKDWFHHKCYALIMPQERSVDIDSEVDLAVAEYFLKKWGRCYED